MERVNKRVNLRRRACQPDSARRRCRFPARFDAAVSRHAKCHGK
jgi:hypothetical protein